MWVVKLERVIDGGTVCQQEVATFDVPVRINGLCDLGLTLDDGKAILSAMQQTVVSEQVAGDAHASRTCDGCGNRRHVKDHRHGAGADHDTQATSGLSKMPDDRYPASRPVHAGV